MRYSLFLVVAIGVTVLILLAASSARSTNNPAWDNEAGAANHICYTHQGVAQITTPGYGSSNYLDPTVVCRDGWAFDLSDTPWNPQ